MKTNYQLILDNELKLISDKRPKLLLHSCCAPCSSYVLEYLCHYFDITVLYYNPNIYPESEFEFRSKEQVRLVELMNLSDKVKVICCSFESEKFYESIKGLEHLPEGGDRCKKCYYLRLDYTAQFALKHKFDYFTTTLTISPHKNSDVLNQIGKDLSEKYGIKYLFSDFKKKNGYKRSCDLSREYGLYRQDYCGCVFSVNK